MKKLIIVPTLNEKKNILLLYNKINKGDKLRRTTEEASDPRRDELLGAFFHGVDDGTTVFKGLKNIGAKMINFDYHLRPRIDKYQEEERYGLEKMRNGYDNVIVWGASEYATRMLENKFFSGQISFFVDSDPGKQGKKVNGVLVKSPDAIIEEKDALIFIASIQFYRDIYKEILNMGISADQVLDANAF